MTLSEKLLIALLILCGILIFLNQRRKKIPTAAKFRNVGFIIMVALGCVFFLGVLLFIYAWSFV